MKKVITEFLIILLVLNLLGFLSMFYEPKPTYRLISESDVDKFEFLLGF